MFRIAIVAVAAIGMVSFVAYVKHTLHELHKEEIGYGQFFIYSDTLELRDVLLAVERHKDAVLQRRIYPGGKARYYVMGYQ